MARVLRHTAADRGNFRQFHLRGQSQPSFARHGEDQQSDIALGQIESIGGEDNAPESIAGRPIGRVVNKRSEPR